MIIVDYNQVFIASIMVQSDHTRSAIDINEVRRMVLNSFRTYRLKFGAQYGEMVIAADSGSSWRKEVFPYYKARRKLDQTESKIDWGAINKALNEIRADLAENLPYKFIRIDRCEADDIIGCLVIRYNQKHLIISKDKDFIQLQIQKNVDQYNPIDKKMIIDDDPTKYLWLHTIKGDRGDGIPNILSGDNCFVTKERQKKITEKRIEELSDSHSELSQSGLVQRNWHRNNMLINLDSTPSDLCQAIITAYEQAKPKSKASLPAYFAKHKLKDLMGALNDF